MSATTAPGNDLVLYYGDQSYYDGIVILGRMHDDAAARIAAMDGYITVQLQL
ncbi:cyclophilin-like fold protein [Kribbella soli]